MNFLETITSKTTKSLLKESSTVLHLYEHQAWSLVSASAFNLLLYVVIV